MITRQDYMEHRATHDEYYLDIANEVSLRASDKALVERVREALKTDEALNNIPLDFWDARAQQLIPGYGARLAKAARERGTFWATLGDGVCILKVVYRDAARRA